MEVVNGLKFSCSDLRTAMYAPHPLRSRPNVSTAATSPRTGTTGTADQKKNLVHLTYGLTAAPGPTNTAKQPRVFSLLVPVMTMGRQGRSSIAAGGATSFRRPDISAAAPILVSTSSHLNLLLRRVEIETTTDVTSSEAVNEVRFPPKVACE